MTTRTVRIVVLVGGSAQALGRYARSLGADLVVATDVAGQLAAAGLRESQHLVLVPLGVGHTCATLAARVAEAFPELAETALKIKDLPVELEKGAGQLRVIGFFLAKLFEAEGGDRFLEKRVFEPVMHLASGALTNVEIVVIYSLAGGTGSGAVLPLTELMVRAFTSRVQATVSVTLTAVGAETFLACGDMIWHNAAPALEECLRYTMELPRDEREFRAMFVTAGPLDRVDKEARACHMRAILPPLIAGSTRDRVDEVRVDSPMEQFGQIRIFQPSIVGEMPSEAVLWLTGSAYSLALEDIISNPANPNTAVCRGVDFVVIRQDTPVTTLEEIETQVASSPERAPERLLERAQAIQPVNVVIRVRMDERHALGIDQVLSGARVCPASRAQYEGWVSDCRGLIAALTAELRTELRTSARQQKARRRASRHLAHTLAALYPHRWSDSMAAALRGRRERVHRFVAAIERYRRIAESVAECDAKVRALESSIAGLERDLGVYLARPKLALELIHEVLGANHSPWPATVLQPHPLDHSFQDLLLASERCDKQEVTSILLRSVRSVSEQGIARMLSLPPEGANVQGIAHHIASGKADVNCPPPGFRVRQDPPEQSHLVLPPVSEEFRDQLQDALRALESPTRVTTRSDTEAGLAVVTFKVYRVAARDQIVTGIHEKARRELSLDGVGEMHILAPFVSSGAMHVQEAG